MPHLDWRRLEFRRLHFRGRAFPAGFLEIETRLGFVGIHKLVLEVAVHGGAQCRVGNDERLVRLGLIEQLAVGVDN